MATTKKIILLALAIIITTYIDVFISFIVASNVLLLLISKGVSKRISLFASVCVCVFTFIYIKFNYRILYSLKERQ